MDTHLLLSMAEHFLFGMLGGFIAVRVLFLLAQHRERRRQRLADINRWNGHR